MKRLKPWISGFSPEIEKYKKHGDSVKTGGKITAILDLSSYQLDIAANEIEAYVTIDDSIGKTELLFIKDSFKILNDMYKFQLDQIILAEGKVLSRKTSPEDPKSIPNIVCWSMKPLEECENRK